MIYRKYVVNNIIECITCVNRNGEGNLSEEEYDFLLNMIHNIPEGKVIADNNGDYAYIDAPQPEEVEQNDGE